MRGHHSPANAVSRFTRLHVPEGACAAPAHETDGGAHLDTAPNLSVPGQFRANPAITAHSNFPRPARYEWGEGQGEGLLIFPSSLFGGSVEMHP